MQHIDVIQTGDALGAEVRGVNIAKPLVDLSPEGPTALLAPHFVELARGGEGLAMLLDQRPQLVEVLPGNRAQLQQRIARWDPQEPYLSGKSHLACIIRGRSPCGGE